MSVSGNRLLNRRRLAQAATAAVTVSGVMLLLASPALAHIGITPSSAAAGSAQELTFRVPDEEPNADTVRFDMLIPTNPPIAQVLVKPVPGWSATVKTITLAKPVVTDDGSFSQAVSEVIWSGGRIAPGQYQDFSISADPLPSAAGTMVFKAIQTYSNGDIVRWIDVSQPGQPAPGPPAPTLILTTGSTTAQTASAPTGSSTADPKSAGWPGMLAIAALVAGLLALGISVFSLRRQRNTGG